MGLGEKQYRAVLIAGPTASGKSALALDIATRMNGVIVNADSMQVYRDLRVITARPTVEEEARVPHRLYGHMDAAIRFSTGTWLADAQAALGDIEGQGKLPVFVGGTGLYFKALTQGISAVPPIPQEIRDDVNARLAANGVEALHTELTGIDPTMGARLGKRDRTRVSRALEVKLATGRSLSDWHSEGLPPMLKPEETLAMFLAPEREQLYARIDARFETMMQQGALEEVQALARRGLDPLLPAMKAHGVPWLVRHLAGELTREQAITASQFDTRHYAKRQFTWFRHQLPAFKWLTPDEAGRQYLSGS